jgi:cytoskeletal protein RodZ
MVEDKDNLSVSGDLQNDGHEFLPLDFSESEEKKDSLNDLRRKYFPGSASEAEEKEPEKEQEISTPEPEKETEKPAEEKEPQSQIEDKTEPAPVAAEEIKQEKPIAEITKSETQPDAVKAEEEKKSPANLHEIFPEEKSDDDEFPKAEHKHDPEVEKIKQKFESELPKIHKLIPSEPKKDVPKASAPSVKAVKLSPRKEPIRIVGSISSKNASFGQILQEARVRSGLSLNQVEQSTKIKMQYLESIEMDDLKNLPPLVYVNAYVKNLCSLYGISAQETDLILSNVKQDAGHVVSEEIIHHLEDEKQVNTEEEQRTKRFMFLAGVVIIAIILVIVGIGMFFAYAMSSEEKDIQEVAASTTEETPAVSESGSTETAPVKIFESRNLNKLIPPQDFSMDELLPSDSGN